MSEAAAAETHEHGAVLADQLEPSVTPGNLGKLGMWTFLAGDAMTGVTIMQMESGLDTGPMLIQEAVAIAGKAAGVLEEELARLGARLMSTVLDDLDFGVEVV